MVSRLNMVQRVENVFHVSSDDPHDILGRSILGARCLAGPSAGGLDVAAWDRPCIFISSTANASPTLPVSYVQPVNEHGTLGMAGRHDVKLSAHKQLRLLSPFIILRIKMCI